MLGTGQVIDRRLETQVDVDSETFDRHSTVQVGGNCCGWLTEAYALSAHGMPVNSFSLVIDGEPAIDQSSSVFELIKEDAAWHVAQDRWFMENSVPLGLVVNLYGGCYFSSIFPQIIDDIIEGRSIVRCNFPTGHSYDPERILEEHRHLSVVESNWDFGPESAAKNWQYAWSGSRWRNRIQPQDPLPSSLLDLALEEVATDEEIVKSGTAKFEWDTVKLGFIEGLPEAEENWRNKAPR